MSTVLPICYFGNALYYALLLQQNCVVDVHENFTKQTYRTRCDIYGANGLLGLSVPVEKIHGEKVKMKDLNIKYDEDWQAVHWRSITSAYRRSPFFEYYDQELESIFNTKYINLLELNAATNAFVAQALGYKILLQFSEKFIEKNIAIDGRTLFKPSKQQHITVDFPDYIQVFNKTFLPNLSVLDLLFNEGPNTIDYLKSLDLTSLKN